MLDLEIVDGRVIEVEGPWCVVERSPSQGAGEGVLWVGAGVVVEPLRGRSPAELIGICRRGRVRPGEVLRRGGVGGAVEVSGRLVVGEGGAAWASSAEPVVGALVGIGVAGIDLWAPTREGEALVVWSEQRADALAVMRRAAAEARSAGRSVVWVGLGEAVAEVASEGDGLAVASGAEPGALAAAARVGAAWAVAAARGALLIVEDVGAVLEAWGLSDGRGGDGRLDPAVALTEALGAALGSARQHALLCGGAWSRGAALTRAAEEELGRFAAAWVEVEEGRVIAGSGRSRALAEGGVDAEHIAAAEGARELLAAAEEVLAFVGVFGEGECTDVQLELIEIAAALEAGLVAVEATGTPEEVVARAASIIGGGAGGGEP